MPQYPNLITAVIALAKENETLKIKDQSYAGPDWPGKNLVGIGGLKLDGWT